MRKRPYNYKLQSTRFIWNVFLFLFALSTCLVAIPVQGVLAYSPFGEVYFCADEYQETEEIRGIVKYRVKEDQGKFIRNLYILLTAYIVFLSSLQYHFRLPKFSTIVDYKVRMDN